MAGPVRVHFKFAYNGKTHRFASILRDEPLFEAVTGKVASLVAETDYDLFWNDDESTVILECAADLATAVDFAVSTRKSANDIPCVHLTVVERCSSEEEIVADVPVRSPEELLPKIKEHLRRLFDSALDEKWSSALRDAMAPLVCPETQNLLRPTERCAAEIAEQLLFLQKKVPAELKELLLQLPREDLKNILYVWFHEDSLKRAETRGIHDKDAPRFDGRAWSTAPAHVACTDVLIVLKMALGKPAGYYCQDWEEDDEDIESEVDEEDFGDDWIAQKATAILKQAKQIFETAQANPVYPCPTDFLQKIGDGPVAATAVGKTASLGDRITRLRENLRNLPNSHPDFLRSTHPTAMAHQADTLSVYYYERTDNDYFAESKLIEPDIAVLLRRTVENVPVEMLRTLQILKAGDLAKVVLCDWIDRIVEEKRAVGNVQKKENQVVLSHCPADCLRALLYVGAAAEDYPAELEHAVLSALKNYREVAVAKWTAESKQKEVFHHGMRWFSLIIDEIDDAVSKYMPVNKAAHFACEILPQPAFGFAGREEEQTNRAQIIESLQMTSEMRHYLTDSGEVHAELVELLRHYVRKSSKKRLERFPNIESDVLASRLLMLWFTRLDRERLIAMRKQGNEEKQWLDFSPAKLAMLLFADAAFWFGCMDEFREVLTRLNIRKGPSDVSSTVPVNSTTPISSENEALIQKHAAAILKEGIANLTPVLLSQPPGPGHPDYIEPEVLQQSQYPQSLQPVQPMQLLDQSMAAVNLNASVEQPQPWTLPVVPQQQVMQPQQAPQTGYGTNGYGYQSGAPVPHHSMYTGAPVQQANYQPMAQYVQQQPAGNGNQTGYHQYPGTPIQYQITQQPSQVYYPGYGTPQQPVMQQPYQQSTDSALYPQPYPTQQANCMPQTIYSAVNPYNAFTM